MIAYILLTHVFLFLISHSVLPEHAHVTGFGNIFVHFLDGSSLWLAMLLLLIQMLTLMLCLWYFRIYRDEASIVSLGLTFPISRRTLVGALLGLVIPLSIFIFYLLKNATEIYDDGMSVSYLAQLVVVFSLVAFAEELLFRGYLLNTLLNAFHPVVSVMITSAIFSLVHVGNPGMTPLGLFIIFLLGCLLSLFFLYSKKLWMPIAFHLTYNFSLVVCSHLLSENPVDDYFYESGPFAYDPTFYWKSIVILCLLITVFVYMNYRKNTLKIDSLKAAH